MACLGVGEPTNTAVWPTVTRTVSLQPQHYGDLTFGITLVYIHSCLSISKQGNKQQHIFQYLKLATTPCTAFFPIPSCVVISVIITLLSHLLGTVFCLWNSMNSVRQIGSGCVAVCEVFDPILHTSGFIQSQLTLSASR